MVSGYNIYKIIRDYKTDQNSYKKVRELASHDEFTGNVDWDKLESVNSDIRAWLYLKDSNIDYPVVLSHDNNEYLHTLFDKSWGNAGSLFIDATTDDPFDQFSTIVYGHHMKDGSMFGNLKKFKDIEYEKEHSRFELVTPEQKYHLDVVAFLNCPSDSNIYRANNNSDKQKEEYLRTIDKYALYKTDIDIDINDTIVVLSTCAYEYDGARYVVVGKLSPWE